MDIRDRARTYLAQVPSIPGEIRSDTNEAQFTKLSGITQNMLLQSWGLQERPDKTTRADPPPGLTSCNSFVAVYAGGIGIAQKDRSLGQFGLEKKLTGWGKAFAWIPATAGGKPKYGDIFEVGGTNHQGVSLDFDAGGAWNTAEGGQGGRKQQPPHDIIKRRSLPQAGDLLVHPKGPVKGWVDVELFASGPAKPAPVTMPAWLSGWWEVPWRGRFFYYFFESGFKASWTFVKPISDAFAPLQFSDTATVTIDGPAAITLKWSATGSVEKFMLAGTDRILVGTWNTAEPLIATRMF